MTLLDDAPSVLLGDELPQIIHEPPDVASRSAAEDAIELANAYAICDGHPLSPSQEFRLRNGMAERADGTWAAGRVADFGGRQGAGKTDTIIARKLAGLLLLGEKLLIYTAHEAPTAGETFLRMQNVIDGYDDLRKRVVKVRYGNDGSRGFEFKGGARLLYKARTGKSGRGYAKADVVFYDEAQHLHPEHLAGSGPARLANPNSQAWWAGSGGLANSDQAWSVRRLALSDKRSRLAYTEHTAEVVEVASDGSLKFIAPDPSDRLAWARANPGLGRWVTWESMQDQFDELGPERFARECLCVWEPDRNNVADLSEIPVALWDSLIDAGSTPDPARCTLALDTNPERSWFTLCLAGERADGLHHGEITKSFPDKSSAVLAAVAAANKLGGISVTCSESAALAGDIERAGGTADVMKPGEQAAATAKLIDATRGEAPLLRHRGEPALRRAVELADTKPYSDGGMVWARRKAAGDISPLTALTMAYGRLGAERPLGDPLDQILG